MEGRAGPPPTGRSPAGPPTLAVGSPSLVGEIEDEAETRIVNVK